MSLKFVADQDPPEGLFVRRQQDPHAPFLHMELLDETEYAPLDLLPAEVLELREDDPHQRPETEPGQQTGPVVGPEASAFGNLVSQETVTRPPVGQLPQAAAADESRRHVGECQQRC